MIRNASPTGYSSEIRIELRVDGRETLEQVLMRDGMKADSEEVCFG